MLSHFRVGLSGLARVVSAAILFLGFTAGASATVFTLTFDDLTIGDTLTSHAGFDWDATNCPSVASLPDCSWKVVGEPGEVPGASGLAGDQWLKGRTQKTQSEGGSKGTKITSTTATRPFVFIEMDLYTDSSRGAFPGEIVVTTRLADTSTYEFDPIMLADGWQTITAADLVSAANPGWDVTGVGLRAMWINAPGIDNPNGGKFGMDNFTYSVPEPSSLALLGIALAGIGFAGRGRRARTP